MSLALDSALRNCSHFDQLCSGPAAQMPSEVSPKHNSRESIHLFHVRFPDFGSQTFLFHNILPHFGKSCHIANSRERYLEAWKVISHFLFLGGSSALNNPLYEQTHTHTHTHTPSLSPFHHTKVLFYKIIVLILDSIYIFVKAIPFASRQRR